MDVDLATNISLHMHAMKKYVDSINDNTKHYAASVLVLALSPNIEHLYNM